MSEGALERRLEQQKATIDEHESRLENHGTRLDDLEAEERRTRKRLHDLESDRHALSLATGAVTVLATKVGAMVDNVSEVAEEAAARALSKDRLTRRVEFRRSWQFRFTAIGAFVGVAGVVTAAIALIVH